MKIIAITGKAQTGKGAVSEILAYHLRMNGKKVIIVPAYLSILNELFYDSFNHGMYGQYFFNKESIREDLQKMGDKINEKSSVLKETLMTMSEYDLFTNFDYIILDSWRCTDSYTTLAQLLWNHIYISLRLIQVVSDRDGIKGSGLEHHKTEGDVTDWPAELVSTVTNNKFTSYAELSMKIEHLIQTHVI